MGNYVRVVRLFSCLSGVLLWCGMGRGSQEYQDPKKVLIASMFVRYEAAPFASLSGVNSIFYAFQSAKFPILLNADLVFTMLSLKQFNRAWSCPVTTQQTFLGKFPKYGDKEYVTQLADPEKFIGDEAVKEAETWCLQLVESSAEEVSKKRDALCNITRIKNMISQNVSRAADWYHWAKSSQSSCFLSAFREVDVNFNPDKWDIFIVPSRVTYDLAQPLVLFIPYSFYDKVLTEMPAVEGMSPGFNIEHCELVKFDQLEKRLTDIVRVQKQRKSEDLALLKGTNTLAFPIAASITQVLTPYSEKSPFLWNIFFIGHGSARPESEKTPITEMLRPVSGERESSMVGIPTHDFMHILDYFRGTGDGPRAAAIVWGTCFGGGYHALAIQQQTALSQLIAKKAAQAAKKPQTIENDPSRAQYIETTKKVEKELLGDKRSYVAISLAPIDQTTVIEKEGLTYFFAGLEGGVRALLDHFYRAGPVSVAMAKAIYEEHRPAFARAAYRISKDDPIIMFPTVSPSFGLLRKTTFVITDELVANKKTTPDSTDVQLASGKVQFAGITLPPDGGRVYLATEKVDVPLYVLGSISLLSSVPRVATHTIKKILAKNVSSFLSDTFSSSAYKKTFIIQELAGDCGESLAKVLKLPKDFRLVLKDVRIEVPDGDEKHPTILFDYDTRPYTLIAEKGELGDIVTMRVESIVKSCGGLHGLNQEGNPPLIVAFNAGDSESVIRQLIAQGVRVGDKNRGGYNALHEAIAIYGVTKDRQRAQQIEKIILLLVDHVGVDINAPDVYGETVLSRAASGWLPVDFVRVFIDHGANAKVTTSAGVTLLDSALFKYRAAKSEERAKMKEISKLLHRAGATTFLEDELEKVLKEA